MSEFLRVAFALPVEGSFTYRNDPDSPARVGMRVEANFGRRLLKGYVVGESDASDVDESLIKRIGRTLDAEPLFGPGTADLARWISGMYFCSLGEALGTMLPSGKRESPAGAGLEADAFEIGRQPLELSPEQGEALRNIVSARAGTTYLYGLTGTGKTEVFLQAAEATLAEGRSVIYLVPEIALSGQVAEAARARFGTRCAVLHSRLTPSKRLAEWRRALAGKAGIVIGARSAVFAPVRDLGLIVIDEEHEGSYKAGNTPRYHARQVAMRRATAEGARLVMGSATPSAEAWQACAAGTMARSTLTSRPSGGAPPAIEIVDMRGENGPISSALRAALLETKTAGGQSILFLNRRGFSHFFLCSTCGEELTCKHCSVPLTFHKEKNALLCHYCGFRAPPPKSCPACGSLDIGWAGFGTERVEEEVRSLFPDWKILRLDADTTTKVGSLESALEDFRAGKADLLLGTQMVAKGLNFPGVKTVGVVLADTGLNLPDFRAAERTFSLIVQVAGRAGRFSPDGRVFVQTYRPDSPVIRLAAALDTEAFYARELAIREMTRFPPFARLIRIVFRSKDKDRCAAASGSFAEAAAPLLPAGAELLGPAECPLAMISGSARRQVILRAATLAPLQRALKAALAAWGEGGAHPGVYVEIDVDPVSLL